MAEGGCPQPALAISTEPGLNRVEKSWFLNHSFPVGSTELLGGQILGISTKFFPGRKPALHLEKLIWSLAREVPRVIMLPSVQLSHFNHTRTWPGLFDTELMEQSYRLLTDNSGVPWQSERFGISELEESSRVSSTSTKPPHDTQPNLELRNSGHQNSFCIKLSNATLLLVMTCNS